MNLKDIEYTLSIFLVLSTVLVGAIAILLAPVWRPMLWDAFVDWLIRRSSRTPFFHIEGYMERFWIIPYRSWRETGWIGRHIPALRVHHILRSDRDCHFHDHPWTYISVILRGEYTEVTPQWDASGLYLGDLRTTYRAGDILFRRHSHYHRLEVPQGATVWTLFMTFAWRQKWGFLTQPDHKMRWEDYLNDPSRETIIGEDR